MCVGDLIQAALGSMERWYNSAPMQPMIDIHCHILPGIDDGAQNLEEAIGIISAEVEGGTGTFVATPHFIERMDYERINKLPELIALVKGEMARQGIEAEIVQGGEIYPADSMIWALDQRLPITVGGKGKHMLVDLPLASVPNDIDSLLYEVQVRGITPILAHPERASFILQDPDRIPAFLEKGVALQVNAGSLFGRYGPHSKSFAEMILKRRWAHFLSSDSHRPPRAPVMARAVDYLADMLDAEYLEMLTSGSARCVLEGRALPKLPEAPPEKAKSGWLAKLIGR
jgi:protein-tyrosine phosphatase